MPQVRQHGRNMAEMRECASSEKPPSVLVLAPFQPLDLLFFCLQNEAAHAFFII